MSLRLVVKLGLGLLLEASLEFDSDLDSVLLTGEELVRTRDFPLALVFEIVPDFTLLPPAAFIFFDSEPTDADSDSTPVLLLETKG